MSSSVMGNAPDFVGNGDEILCGQRGHGSRVGNTFRRPNVERVLAGTEPLQPVFQARLLVSQRVLTEPCTIFQKRQRAVAEIRARIIYEQAAPPNRTRCLPPMVRHTKARSRESNSSTPRLVSITSGPETA